MPLDKTQLLDFLGVVEKELSRQITLVAVEGTAMTLLDLKPSTIDIDFTGPGEDIADFKEALKNISHLASRSISTRTASCSARFFLGTT